MEFRLDFFFRIVMDAIFYLVNILFFKVIYGHTQDIGGWSEPQTLFFISCVFVADALYMTFFANNAWWLPIYINRGDLDYYLTKPVSPLFFLSLREFAANSFLNLVLAVGIFIYNLLNLEQTFTALGLFSCLLFIGVGVLLHFLINLLFLLPVFWTHSNRGFSDLFFLLSHTMERPHRIYYGAARIVLSTILPFILVVSYPASFVIEGFSWAYVFHILGVFCLLSLIIAFIWRQGLKGYSSASS